MSKKKTSPSKATQAHDKVDASVVAFRRARLLAPASRIVRFEIAPADFNHPWLGNQTLENQWRMVRKTLVDAYRNNGASVTTDYDGAAFMDRLPRDAQDEFRVQIDHHQEAAYLYGLALGLLLGTGGVR